MRQDSSRYGLLRSAASVFVATVFAVFVALPASTKADSEQYSVVARIDASSAGLTASDIVVRVEHVSVVATAVEGDGSKRKRPLSSIDRILQAIGGVRR
jgi:hypothetical protein